MSLDLDKLRALFDLLAEKDIAEFEHEENGVRLRVARGGRDGARRRRRVAVPSGRSRARPPRRRPGSTARRSAATTST